MRESQRQKLIMAGLGKAEKASRRRKYKCILPDCRLDSIKSHSQQKKCQLDAISEGSSVFAMNKNLYQMFKTEKRELLTMKSIGEASRYKGYCNAHDTSIFSPIENRNLDIHNPEHNFLLLLRAVSHEFANKRDMYDQQKDILAKIGHLFSYEGRRAYEASNYGVKLFLEKDAPYYMFRLFEIYDSRDWSQIEYNSFLYEKNIGVSSTTCFSPFRENHTAWMSVNFEQPQPFISLSVVPSLESTAVSFAWFSENSEFCKSYKKIHAEQENIAKIINAFILSESEDVCIRPSLWEKLSQEDKETIYKHMGTSDTLPNSESIPVVIDW